MWRLACAGNATSVVEWLNSLVGQPVDELSVGAAPMDWQPPAAGPQQRMPSPAQHMSVLELDFGWLEVASADAPTL